MTKKLKHIRGQVSIFLALVFIVMFFLFSMTVSVGMFIHDKINLQNSTDLASYYVASKQAELLTAIAHTNYQIRQSWKLLSFRYRVFGSSAREGVDDVANRNPSMYLNWYDFYNREDDYRPTVYNQGPPRVCIAAKFLFRQMSNDNPCKRVLFTAPYLPSTPGSGAPGLGTIASGVSNANLILAKNEKSNSFINWWFANAIYAAHKLEQRDRRALIEVLAENLSKPIVEGDGGMKDLDGRSVFEGAQKTFQYNLSESNKEGHHKIKFKNSLEGVNWKDWLKVIYVNVNIPFAAYEKVSGSRVTTLKPHFLELSSVHEWLDGPLGAEARQLKGYVDHAPNDVIHYQGTAKKYADTTKDLYNVTIGYEKNPWYMVYNETMGTANSHPVLLSSIFGKSIEMQAKAYSKPFGGRIGPWYMSQWPPGSAESSGGVRTDPWTAKRTNLPNYGNDLNKMSNGNLLPNYSRFPGDTKGLTTYGSMVAAGPLYSWNTNAPGPDIRDYSHIVYSYLGEATATYNDPLSQNYMYDQGATAYFNGAGPKPTEITDSYNRRLEIAAIAPDAFDVTYYSILPGFYDYFIENSKTGKKRLANNNWAEIEMKKKDPEVQLRGDLGSHSADGKINFDILDQLKIDDEVQRLDKDRFPRTVSRARNKVAWFFDVGKNSDEKFYRFLTGWNSGVDVMDYTTPDGLNGRFGHCATPLNTGKFKDKYPRIPSECINGGRVGYSVKMISRDYLVSPEHDAGGGSKGRIKNPPL